jgi:tropomodulin
VTQEQSRGDSHASSIPSYSHQKLEKLLSNKGGGDEEEPIDLEDLMQRIDDDDPTLVDLNLNNHPLISSQQIYQLIEALQNNTHITKLSLTNIKFDDHHAAELAKLLCNNDHWITLNLDSNRLANDGIRVIMKALTTNATLSEIRMCNQYSRGGHRIESEIAKYLQKNTTLKKLGYSFTCNGPRLEVEKAIMRNIDIQRQQRFQQSIT